MTSEQDDRIYATLERLEGKVDTFMQRIVILETKDTSGRVEKLEERVRDVEKFQATAKVYMGLAGFAGAGIVAIVVKLLHLG